MTGPVAGAIWANKGDFGKGDHFLISISSTLRVTPSLPVGKGVCHCSKMAQCETIPVTSHPE